jgi:hypothetical protein
LFDLFVASPIRMSEHIASFQLGYLCVAQCEVGTLYRLGQLLLRLLEIVVGRCEALGGDGNAARRRREPLLGVVEECHDLCCAALDGGFVFVDAANAQVAQHMVHQRGDQVGLAVVPSVELDLGNARVEGGLPGGCRLRERRVRRPGAWCDA